MDLSTPTRDAKVAHLRYVADQHAAGVAQRCCVDGVPGECREYQATLNTLGRVERGEQ